MSNESKYLSPEGQERREQILALALDYTRRRRRRAIRAGAAACVCVAAALLGLLYLTLHEPATPKRPEIVARAHSQPAGPSTSQSIIRIICTDPSLLERLALQPRASGVRTLTDEQLLAALAQIRRPAGLIRLNGECRIVYRDQPSH